MERRPYRQGRRSIAPAELSPQGGSQLVATESAVAQERDPPMGGDCSRSKLRLSWAAIPVRRSQ